MEQLDLLIRDRLELIGIIVTFAIISMSLANSSYAQTPTSASPVTEFVNSDPDNKDRYITVKYESPQTVILSMFTADHETPLGHAIDFAIQKGYSLDSVIFATEQAKYGATDTYTVFMSKK